MTTTDRKPRVEHRSGGSNLWATPRDFAAGILASLRLPLITLDLAAEASTTLAPRWYGPGGERADALSLDPPTAWAAPGGTRWLNPPYSRQCTVCEDRVWRKETETDPGCAKLGHGSTDIKDWMHRAAAQGQKVAARTSPIVALVPASTDTAWWRQAMCSVSEVVLVSGRLRFLAPGPGGALAPASAGAAFGSAVLVWSGPRPVTVPYVIRMVDAQGALLEARGYSAAVAA